MRIAVCEDKECDRIQLVLYIKKELTRRRLSAEVLAYKSGEALLHAASQIEIQIFFLDIIMPGISGVEAASILRHAKKGASIVFITSSRDYYADGFAVGAVHYLLKPYTENGISEAMNRCLHQVGEKEKYIELMVNRKKCRILLSSLLWAESKDKICCLHLHSGECHTYLRLDDLKQQLDDPRFLRCHRSFLINMDEVSRMENTFFCMTDDSKIPIRQKKRAALRMEYEDYLFERMRRRR